MSDVLRMLQNGRLPPRVLIVGADARVDPFLTQLVPALNLPICRCVLPGSLILPTGEGGSLVLRDVSTLTPLQQRELLVWLDRQTCQMQLVAISSKPLYAQVQDGTFDEQLYYRLNGVLENLAVAD